MLSVDQWLQEHRPSPDLADKLRCVWRGDLGNLQTPLPDECLDLVWVDDGSIWLSGPESRSWARGYSPGSNAVGVRFKPGLGPPILGLAASEVRDARIRLDELWGERDARDLTERITVQPDDGGRVRELECAVRRLVVNARPVDEVAIEVAVGLGQVRPVSVRDLSGSTGQSERQIHRRCCAAFGYGPAVLARILRLQRVLQLARLREHGSLLADLASAAGYFDQQHLAHDVQAIVGTTPALLLRPS